MPHASTSKASVKPDLKAKVVFVGKSGVGKTSIILRHDGQGFYSKVSPTLGADFVSSVLPINGKIVELQIWDTAGQERHFSALPCLRNVLAAIVVYDITDRESFDDLKKWINEIERRATMSPLFFIVGNKLDLECSRMVIEPEGAEFAKQIGASFFETSALNGEGIRRVIIAVAEQLLGRQLTNPESVITLDDQSDNSNEVAGTGATTATGTRHKNRFCCST